MFIGLLSDTHGVFDAPLRHFFAEVDQIWHAGDFGNIATADAIAAFKPLLGVHGNCDDQTVRLVHPPVRWFEIEQMSVLMTHIGGYPGHYDYKALQLIQAHQPQIFICGHSHILRIGTGNVSTKTETGNIPTKIRAKNFSPLHINPGAAGHYGPHPLRTALRFRIEKGKIFDMEVWEKENH